MQFPVDFSDKKKLRTAFSWQAKNNLAPRFGTVSIGTYQVEHYAIIAEIEKRIRNAGFYHGADVKIKEPEHGSFLNSEVTATGKYMHTDLNATVTLGGLGDILNGARR